jgi:hypothetical protein
LQVEASKERESDIGRGRHRVSRNEPGKKRKSMNVWKMPAPRPDGSSVTTAATTRQDTPLHHCALSPAIRRAGFGRSASFSLLTPVSDGCAVCCSREGTDKSSCLCLCWSCDIRRASWTFSHLEKPGSEKNPPSQSRHQRRDTTQGPTRLSGIHKNGPPRKCARIR